MDRTEAVAEAHLASRGHASIVFEPDGNVPPDFLVDGRIAVEVRRLNQNETTEAGHEALEAVVFPLRKLVERLLPQLGPADASESWFVMYTFRRPLPDWRVIEKAIREKLQAFKQSGERRPGRLQVLPNLKLDLIRTSRPHADFFLLGGCIDRDSGGFVLAELNKNIRICIQEKARKVAKVRGKYPVWWLLLVDYIAHGIDAEDHDDLRRLLEGEHAWDRIVVVNPLDASRAFEL